METILSFIAALSPIILTYMGYSFKAKLKKMELADNAQSKERKKDNSELLQRMENSELKLKKIQKSLNEIKKDNKFRIEFRNAIRIKTQETIQLLENVLTGRATNLLLYWSEKIESFGLDFSYSKKRQGREQERAEYLTTILNIRIKDFYEQANDVFPAIKEYKEQEVSFSRFAELVIVHKHTFILNEKLIKNGLSRQDVIDVFSDYIKDFSEYLITIIQTWENLKT